MEHYFTNNDSLNHDISKIDINIKDVHYFYYTDSGTFSKKGMDKGTEILLKTFPYNSGKILDLGCGCGAIGIYLSKKGFEVTMSDVNKRALELASTALKEQMLKGEVVESDSYSNIKDKFDFVISNPPIRVGKEKLYDMIMNSKDHLNNGGELWIVVRKDKGALSLKRDMETVFKAVQIVEKSKGYYIIKAENH